MVTKSNYGVAEQRQIRCAGCNRWMWHVLNGSARWLCGYCGLHSLTKKTITPRSKKVKYVPMVLKHQELYDKVRWAKTVEELNLACDEVVQRLAIKQQGEDAMELNEIVECGRERRNEFLGLRFDGGTLDV